MKIVFLDVDGPLTYSAYENEKTANIDVEKVLLLKIEPEQKLLFHLHGEVLKNMCLKSIIF